MTDTSALNGILFVLHAGIPWKDLLQSLSYGSGMPCWRRLRDWWRLAATTPSHVGAPV